MAGTAPDWVPLEPEVPGMPAPAASEAVAAGVVAPELLLPAPLIPVRVEPVDDSAGLVPDCVPLEPEVPGMPAPAASEAVAAGLIAPEVLPVAPVCPCAALPNASAATTAAARGSIFRDGRSNMKFPFCL